jgi:hypothetical protein
MCYPRRERKDDKKKVFPYSRRSFFTPQCELASEAKIMANENLKKDGKGGRE